MSLSKVKRAQLGCSSLMFAIAHSCRKRDDSVHCAPAGERAVARGPFLQITIDDCFGPIVPDSPRAFPAGSGPARFEDNNQKIASNCQMLSR
jgi:hypothetical protein